MKYIYVELHVKASDKSCFHRQIWETKHTLAPHKLAKQPVLYVTTKLNKLNAEYSLMPKVAACKLVSRFRGHQNLSLSTYTHHLVPLTPKLLVIEDCLCLTHPNWKGKCFADLAEKCTVNLLLFEKIHCRKVTKTLELNPALKTSLS